MKKWEMEYKSKLTTAEEAVKRIKSGDKVVFTHAGSEPLYLVDAMVKNAESYSNVTISNLVTLGKGEYSLPQYKDHFKINSWFVSPCVRQAIADGYGDFTPVFFHEVPNYIRRGIFEIDVCLAMVSSPDEHGYCSLGVASDYSTEAIRSAKLVIAQVNDQVPVVYGNTFVHVDDLDVIVEHSAPVPEMKIPVITETELAIGRNCALLVEDGSTLQLGIGAIPDAVLASLTHKKDLGIHSEMISDGVVDLIEAGVINNSRKALNPGKSIVTFLMGTKRLYDFANRNPGVELRTVDYVNHPMIIAKNNDMVCINSALAVDFMGQIVSDSIGTKQFSGVGGQVDFMRGAAMTLDGKGKGIIAMPSVAKKKDGSMISKITPFIDHGAAVTTSRQDADYVVTEYGIAELKGRTLKQRARNLINIAHPQFRDELASEFERRFLTTF
ncbi:MAG: acetyl-CoA hydrolase/transferase family protein [Firmicutes bacterium]|nr:acetyl-CoA hydrolase/transferase family protein [Bacillota bacterium]